MMKYYTPTGKFPPQAIVYLIVVAVTLLPLLSFLYALSGVEVPYLILKCVFPIIFAVLVGASVNMALIGFGKTRNGFWGFILSSLAALWAYYLHWIFYFVYVSRQKRSVNFTAMISGEGQDFYHQILYLVKKPVLVWELLGKYISIGNWSFFGINFNGGLLVFVLILEFAVFFMIAVFIGFMNYDKPFDELSKQWFKYEFLENRKYFLPEDQLVSRLESGNYRGLLTLNEKSLNHTEAVIYFSKYTLFTNGKQYYLTVENAVKKWENKKWTSTIDELVRYIQISPEFAHELRSQNVNISSEDPINDNMSNWTLGEEPKKHN